MTLTRDLLVDRVALDLIGPKAGAEEVIDERPTGRYLTGILYPQQTPFPEEEDETLAAENTRGGGEAVEEAAEEVSLFRSFKPSACGLSFALLSADAPKLQLDIVYARYRASTRLAAPSPESGPDGGPAPKPDGKTPLEWRREPQRVSITLDLSDGGQPPEVAEGLRLHRRVTRKDGVWMVTLQFINLHREVDGGSDRADDPLAISDFIDREEAAFMQFSARVTADRPFAPRPQVLRGGDDDQRIAELIYRDVREYAVGHTCSAEWEEGAGSGADPGWLATSWMPSSIVRKMDAAGDDVIAAAVRASPVGSLHALHLAAAAKADLIATLRAVPTAYLQWLDRQEATISELPARLRPCAQDNITRCREAARRMLEGVDLLAADDQALEAFRLANRAMYIQAAWGRGVHGAHRHGPNDEPVVFVWFPFQLAFALLCLASASGRDHPDRSIFDLIWFPTGGGKTEAYLLLAAYVLFLRRLRHGDRGAGVGVFMRYTLRTLTVQQFQRAAALITACETLRRCGAQPLGSQPFSIGLWVGSDSTPNNFEAARNALAELDPRSSPRQLTACPACDRPLEWRAYEADSTVGCVCTTDDCPLSGDFGRLPVQTVDDDLYASPPSLLIGTVDKFAQVTRQRDSGALFGIGTGTERPDLIIQDELHLIGGPLGSLTGLYEAAIDELCSDAIGRPKIVGSTATIRRAEAQIRLLFNRSSFQFPPPALDAGNSCFAKVDAADPGRRYVGLTTAGRSEKFALQALSASLLQAAADPTLGDETRRDAYWTLVTYFNSLKVLGGALVLMEDDVRVTVDALAQQRGETARLLQTPEELTSRKKSSEIPIILRDLGRTIGDPACVDVLLASNMLSVGVDIPRLGLMVVNGQPKFMSEYIQATSRVGRRAPGLVLTLYNNNKIRDRAHFEAFCSWHSAIYRSVEPSSVTPFAPRARDKALHAPLVALVRHLISPSSPQIPAAREAEVTALLGRIISRIALVDPSEAKAARRELETFLDDWRSRAASGQLNQYWNDRFFRKSLLMSAERAAARRATGRSEAAATPTPNSVRNVEPSVEFVLKESVGVPQ